VVTDFVCLRDFERKESVGLTSLSISMLTVLLTNEASS
jgi:hypothetical protein